MDLTKKNKKILIKEHKRTIKFIKKNFKGSKFLKDYAINEYLNEIKKIKEGK